MNEREYHLDNLCGIFILYMIFIVHIPAHCDIKDNLFHNHLLYLLDCFMGWFFYKSGMYYKKKPVVYALKSDFRRLLIPYFFFNGLGAIADIILIMNKTNEYTLYSLLRDPFMHTLYHEATTGNQAIWFLLSLFIIRISYNFLDSIHIKPIAIAIITIIIAYYLHINIQSNENSACFTLIGYNIHVPYYFGNIFFGMSFYSMGVLLKSIQINIFVFILSFFIYFFHFICPHYMDVRTNEPHTDYILATFFCLSGNLFYNNLSYRFMNKKIALINYIGQNSMVFYCTHFILIRFISELSSFNRLTSFEKIAILTTVTIFALILSDFIFHKKKFSLLVGTK